MESIVQPEASVVQTGRGIRYVSDWAYAYSGSVSVNNIEGTLIEARTGSGVIVGSFQHQYFAGGSDNYKFRVYFNDLLVAATQEPGVTTSIGNTGQFQINLIIPPFTAVKITAENVTDSSANDMGAVLTGRVYGVK